MTGTIEGGLLLNDVLYPGDQVPVSFSFYSSGSAFISGSLKFCYTDGSGVYHERDIPVQTTPSGLQYLATQNIKLPTVTEMGLGDLPLSSAKPKFKITLRNAYVSKTFEQPVTLHNPIDGTITIIGEELYPSDNSLLSFDISSQSNSCKLQSRKLSLAYTDKNGASRTVELLATDSPIAPIPTDSFTYQATNQPISLPGLSTLNLSLANVDAKHDATLILEVEDAGGSKAVVSKSIKLANPLTADPLTAEAITLSDATDDSVYPGDENHVSLSALSKANTINISSVSMEIIPEGGSSTSISLPGGAPSTKTYSLTDGAITIPNRTTLGVSASDLDAGKSATLRVTYTAGEFTKSFDKPVTIGNPISGTLSVASGYVLPADDNTITFNIVTNAHTSELATANFSLRYTDIDGTTAREETSGFSSLTTPTGQTYSSSQTITFPAMSHYPDLSKSVTLVAHITDSAGAEKDVTVDVPMRSHINNMGLEIVKGHGTSGFPVNVTQLEVMDGFTIASGSAKFQWKKDGDSAWREEVLSAPYDVVQTFNTASLLSANSLSLSEGSFVNFRLKAACSDGTMAFSDVWSMAFLKYNYSPNSAKWCDIVEYLDFSRGDFLEAQVGTLDYSVKKSGVLSIGNHINMWTDADGNYIFHLYSGDTTGSRKLRSNIIKNKKAVVALGSSDKNHPDPTVTICFYKDGLFVDGKEGNEDGGFLSWSKNNTDYRDVVSYLNEQNTLEIGQNQGDNRSNSYYNYIRAVRQIEL